MNFFRNYQGISKKRNKNDIKDKTYLKFIELIINCFIYSNKFIQNFPHFPNK